MKLLILVICLSLYACGSDKNIYAKPAEDGTAQVCIGQVNSPDVCFDENGGVK